MRFQISALPAAPFAPLFALPVEALAERGAIRDAAGMIRDADVVEGRSLEGAIERLLGAPDAQYLHVHFARPGCYAARVDRR